MALFIASCSQEDNTGLSTLSPTAPSISIADNTPGGSLIENDQVYEFVVTLSEKQLVDVKVYANQIGGDATIGDDYELSSSIVIPAGSLSGKGTVKILKDDEAEDTETLTIQIGNEKTANASIAPASISFTILNYEEGDLLIDLEWALSETTTDNSGEEIDATDFADMRLLISSNPDNEGDIGEADGGSFESLVLSGDTPDGEYYIVTDFYDANADIMRNIDLELNLNQSGLINDMGYEYLSAISNADGTCELNFYVMTKIIKSGNSYTFEDVSTLSFDLTEVSYTGIDADFDSKITTNEDCTGKIVGGLNANWMFDFWGEKIIDEGTVYYSEDAGVITIESQYVFTTLYSGSEYGYTVSGTGTYDETTGDITLQYYLDQDGFSPSNWAFDNGYQDTPYFEAIITAN